MSSSEAPALIGDGYDEKGYIAAAPRLYPAVRFVYRPMLVEERNRLLAENSKLKPDAQTHNTCKVLALKIRSWDVKSARGEDVRLCWQEVARLKPALYERLLSIVMGLDAPDEDPEAPKSDQEKADSLADQLAAAEQGVAVGDAKAGREAKNS